MGHVSRKRQSWAEGDLFLVPVSDGTFAVGQVLIASPRALNSVVCAISSYRVHETNEIQSMELKDVIFCKFVTRDSLDRGLWTVCGHAPKIEFSELIDYESHERKKFVGTVVHGSGCVQNFVGAYFSLNAWDMYFDPHYFDDLLLSGKLRPPGVIFKSNLGNLP